jgi:hypothetical protein
MKTDLIVRDGEGDMRSGASMSFMSLTAASAVVRCPEGGGRRC